MAARRAQAGWVEAKVRSTTGTRLPWPNPRSPLHIEEALEELLAGPLKVLGHVSQDRGEGGDSEGPVLGDVRHLPWWSGGDGYQSGG